MYLKTFILLCLSASNWDFINGQFNFGGFPFRPNPSAEFGFQNQNSQFQQNQEQSFGFIEVFGTSEKNTNFQQSNSGGN